MPDEKNLNQNGKDEAVVIPGEPGAAASPKDADPAAIPAHMANEASTLAPPSELATALPKDAASIKASEKLEAPRQAHTPGPAAESIPAKSEPMPVRPPEDKGPADTSFKARIWTPLLRPIAALMAICIVTSFLLGITNRATKPLIDANASAASEEARRALIPEADGFVEVPLDEVPNNITALYEATNGVGYIVECYGKGYGGKVPAMVAFGPDGTITGVTFLTNSETPGLGKKLETDEAFSDQFVGAGAGDIAPTDITRIASATISSNAALTAVNAAIDLFHEQVLGEANTALTPDQVRLSLLPNATDILPIEVDIENVTEAWVSDDGNYIIYATAPGIYDEPVTAAVAMNPDGEVLGVWLDTSNQTPGYGLEMAQNGAYLDQFTGLTSAAEVDVIAGSTITSKAVNQAVDTAIAALPAVKEAA